MIAHAVYVNKHLNVFFEKDITAEQMRDIEQALEQMEARIGELDGVRCVTGLWEE